MKLVEYLSNYKSGFASLVHPSAKNDRLSLVRHQSFISSQLNAGLMALCVVPIYLAINGQPGLLEAIAITWFISPIFVAMYLSKTGKYETAHIFSALNFTCLIGYAAMITGGIASFLLPWMLAVPMEAAQSSSRKVVCWATGMVAAALAILGTVTAMGWIPGSISLSLSPLTLSMFGLFSATAYIAGLVFTVQTIHKTSEDTISQSEERYRLLAENTSDMISCFDLSGQVQYVSMASSRVLDTKPEDLLEDGIFERVHFPDRPIYMSGIKFTAEGGDENSVSFRMRKGPYDAEGPQQLVWVEMRCSRVDNHIIAVTRDITERKQHELELIAARKEAEKANRSKTSFLANMSHELRTPLNAILGFSDLLREQGADRAIDSDKRQQFASMIYDSGSHLLSVVNDILDMSKIEAGKFEIIKEPFKPDNIIKSCCSMLKPIADERGVSIVMDVQQGMDQINADPKAFRQILLNLLSNAVKFSFEDKNQTVVVKAIQNKDVFTLTVIDTGIGISKPDIDMLGEPFVQTETSYDRNHEGTGLGLSVVKGLTELHGGSLKIESQLSIGTSASVILPNSEVKTDGIDEDHVSNVIQLKRA